MIDLYTAATPNGQKIHIMLEETGLAYRTHWVRISRGEQFDSDFLAISPNNKIPAIVDDDGPGGRAITLFESGAILLYLADKTGRFLPDEPHHRWETVQWLMWQMGGFGPMLGQAHHFNAYAPMRPDGPVVLPYAQARYTNEAARLYGVLDKHLAEHDYVAAGQYTIADMAILSLVPPRQAPAPGHRELPQRQALVRRHRRPSRRRQGHGQARGHRGRLLERELGGVVRVAAEEPGLTRTPRRFTAAVLHQAGDADPHLASAASSISRRSWPQNGSSRKM